MTTSKTYTNSLKGKITATDHSWLLTTKYNENRDNNGEIWWVPLNQVINKNLSSSNGTEDHCVP
jgi:hypothetical protein